MNDSDTCKIVVLISGSGSNLQALWMTLLITLAHVLCCDQQPADAYGLVRAEQAGIAQQVLSHKDFADR